MPYDGHSDKREGKKKKVYFLFKLDSIIKKLVLMMVIVINRGKLQIILIFLGHTAGLFELK